MTTSPSSVPVAVQQDDATLRQGRLHRFAHHADDAATVGDEALPGEPLVTEVGVALDRLVQIQSPATGCGLKPVDGDGPSAGKITDLR